MCGKSCRVLEVGVGRCILQVASSLLHIKLPRVTMFSTLHSFSSILIIHFYFILSSTLSILLCVPRCRLVVCLMRQVRHTVWHAYVTWLGFACYECIFPEVRNHSLEACALVLIPLRALARTLNLPLGWQLWLGSSSVAAALPHATGWPLPAVWPLPFPTGFKTLVGLACVAGWLLTLVSDAEWSIAASLRRNSLLSRGQITRGGSTSKDAPAVDEKVLGDAVTAPAEEPEEEEGIIVQTPSRKKRSSNRLANLQGGMAAGLAIQGVQTRRSSRLLSPRETPASISSSSRSSSTPVVPKKLR